MVIYYDKNPKHVFDEDDNFGLALLNKELKDIVVQFNKNMYFYNVGSHDTR